jgi:hypothetical protein
MINRKLRNFRCIFVYPGWAQALEAAGFAQNPVWSPSGTKIMFTRFKARRFLPKSLPPFGGPLVVMNPDGSGKRVAVDGGIQNKVDWARTPSRAGVAQSRRSPRSRRDVAPSCIDRG